MGYKQILDKEIAGLVRQLRASSAADCKYARHRYERRAKGERVKFDDCIYCGHPKTKRLGGVANILIQQRISRLQDIRKQVS